MRDWTHTDLLGLRRHGRDRHRPCATVAISWCSMPRLLCVCVCVLPKVLAFRRRAVGLSLRNDTTRTERTCMATSTAVIFPLHKTPHQPSQPTSAPPRAAFYAVSLASFQYLSPIQSKNFSNPSHPSPLASPGVGQGLSYPHPPPPPSFIPFPVPRPHPCAHAARGTMRRTATSASLLLVPEYDAGPVVTTPSIGCSPRRRCEIQRSVGASLSAVSQMLGQNNQCHLPTPCRLCCSCHWLVNDTPPAEKAPKVQNVQLLPLKRRAGMRLLDGPHSVPPSSLNGLYLSSEGLTRVLLKRMPTY
ncbi:hypothetical protein EDB80DRAFT_57620 [Ilyonectria destructans]|nr:hypothetical protein EDB80DRAFT_57620 [Ilyonectria destructans]